MSFRRRSIVTFIPVALIAAAALLGTGGTILAAGSVDGLNPVYQTLPADRFDAVAWEQIRSESEPFSRTRGVFIGKDEGGKTVGAVVHMSTPDYGGPIDLLVAFSEKGTVSKVNVFKHAETDCHVLPMIKGNFLSQFNGVSLWDKLSLLLGLSAEKRGDIQSMTGGTITSKAIFDSVAEARVVFHRLFGVERN